MGPEVVVPVAGILMIIAIVVGPAYFRAREKKEMQETVRHALDKGQSLPPELIAAISRQSAVKRATAHTDLRTGVLWTAVALGVATFGYFAGLEERDMFHPIMGMAAIPGFIGLAFIILSFFNKTKPLED